MINAALQHGKQHCQKDVPDFLAQTLKLSHQTTDKPLLIRLDLGNDSSKNLGILIEDASYFIVKLNPRGEIKEGWLAHAKKH